MANIEFGITDIYRLRPDVRNARTHSKKQVNQIAASIAENGFVNPILINPVGGVIAGHGRLRAAKQLKLANVPTITVTGLSDAQERRLRIADNKIAQNASWDVDLLKVELAAIEIAGLNLELTGFSMGEIDVMRSLKVELERTELVKPPAPVSTNGDIWICSDHRIGCGDLLDGQSLKALMADQLADMILTDPPYNVSNLTHAGGNGRIQHREFAYARGEMTPRQFTEFLANTEGALAAHARDGAVAYVFMDHHHAGEQIAAGEIAFGTRLNICVWVKSNGGMGSLYRSKHELVFVYRVGDVQHVNNVELGRHGRNRTNVWEYGSVNTFGGSRMAELEMHPTTKPVALVSDAIQDVTVRGDVVLDGFMGSGTTLIAAAQTGRRAYGLEIDAGYVDVAVERWMALTGDQAALKATGETYAEVAARRHAAADSATMEESNG